MMVLKIFFQDLYGIKISTHLNNYTGKVQRENYTKEKFQKYVAKKNH